VTSSDGRVTDRRAVLGYVRVSTEHQAEAGVSLAAQTDKIRAMAVLQELTVADVKAVE